MPTKKKARPKRAGPDRLWFHAISSFRVGAVVSAATATAVDGILPIGDLVSKPTSPVRADVARFRKLASSLQPPERDGADRDDLKNLPFVQHFAGCVIR